MAVGRGDGRGLRALSGRVLGWSERVRGGVLAEGHFAGRAHAGRGCRTRVRAALARGGSGCAKATGTCRAPPAREAPVCRLAFGPGVEPTDNAAERAARRGVLWRKPSGGPKSAAGAAYRAHIGSGV